MPMTSPALLQWVGGAAYPAVTSYVCIYACSGEDRGHQLPSWSRGNAAAPAAGGGGGGLARGGSGALRQPASRANAVAGETAISIGDAINDLQSITGVDRTTHD